jgi:hypothetical protein
MYITTLWPERAALGLSKHVYKALIDNITTPFDSLAHAQSFWDDASCQLIYLQPTEINTLNEQQLRCLTDPDFTDLLSGYALHCRITNDYGGGLFILIQNDEESFHDNDY